MSQAGVSAIYNKEDCLGFQCNSNLNLLRQYVNQNNSGIHPPQNHRSEALP